MNWLPIIGALLVVALFARIYFEDRRHQRLMRSDHADFCARARTERPSVSLLVDEIGDEVDCKVYRFPRSVHRDHGHAA